MSFLLNNKKNELISMSNVNNITFNIQDMDLTKLSKGELLVKCEENGIIKCKSKNKQELIDLLNLNTISKKKVKLIIENDETIIENDETIIENDENNEIISENNEIISEIVTNNDSNLNKLYIGHNIDVLKSIQDNSVDLVITSPPYDDLRSYKGNYKLDLTELGKEIYRVLKDGGIYAMIIQDQTKNFGKSLTSFRTAINHCDIIGFKLFETCIYKKLGCEGAWWNKRFRVDHEYIHLFLKGEKPQYFNKEPIKIPSKHAGKNMTGCATRKTDGTTFKSKSVTINNLKCPGTIWDYANGGDKNKLKRKHPAVFPDKIPNDLINVFCPENGLVLDPMCGSGSTIVQAIKNNRKFIGIDIEKDYIEIVKERLNIECNFII
jgi:site-specific DNA-methyltransferase (adenine-specific)